MNTYGLSDGLKSTWAYRAVRAAYHFRQGQAWRRLRQRFRQDRQVIERYLATSTETKLQLGSGQNPLPGWLNTDFFPDDASQVHVDVTEPFPFPSNAFDLIYSEHMIEHLTLAGGLNMLRECYRTLKPGGRLRVATPDLEALMEAYRQPRHDYHTYHLAEWLPNSSIKTPAVVFNDFMRNWGHLLIYDHATLGAALGGAGFTEITIKPLQDSDEPRLRNLANDSRMPAGLLDFHTMTFEATKRT